MHIPMVIVLKKEPEPWETENKQELSVLRDFLSYSWEGVPRIQRKNQCATAKKKKDCASLMKRLSNHKKDGNLSFNDHS